MTQEELKKCIGEYRELKKDLWWSNRWGVQKIEGYNFEIYYNDFAGYWQFSWNDPENEHRVADIEDIFDKEQDCEEYAEFGNITRTERLELPSWEDVKKDSETLKNGTYTIAEYKHLFSLNLKILKYFPTQIVLFTDTEKYGWNLSRENYNEARRICVKLFKGGE